MCSAEGGAVIAVSCWAFRRPCGASEAWRRVQSESAVRTMSAEEKADERKKHFMHVAEWRPEREELKLEGIERDR